MSGHAVSSSCEEHSKGPRAAGLTGSWTLEVRVSGRATKSRHEGLFGNTAG